MLKEFLRSLFENMSARGIAPIIEFATASFVVCAAYMAVHHIHKNGKAQNKFLVALPLGLISYAMAKVIVVTWLIEPLIFR